MLLGSAQSTYVDQVSRVGWDDTRHYVRFVPVHLTSGLSVRTTGRKCVLETEHFHDRGIHTDFFKSFAVIATAPRDDC